MPTIPEMKPMTPPKHEFLTTFEFLVFSLEVIIRFENHIVIAANNKLKPNKIKKNCLCICNIPPRKASGILNRTSGAIFLKSIFFC